MMKEIKEFRPNDDMHREFGNALRAAQKAGVNILAYDCIVEPESIVIDKPIIVRTEL